MAQVAHSDWSKNWKPSGSSVNKKYRCNLYYEDLPALETSNTITIRVSAEVEINSPVSASFSGKMTVGSQHSYGAMPANWTPPVSYTYTGSAKTTFNSGVEKKTIISAKTLTFEKTKIKHGVEHIYISAYVSSTNGSWTGEKMDALGEITVPIWFSFPIEYDANDGEYTSGKQTKYEDQDINLNAEVPTYGDNAFLEWNTLLDGTGDSFLPNQLFTENNGRIDIGLSTEKTILYAQWAGVDPPTCDYTELKDFQNFSNFTKGYSQIGVTLSNLYVNPERTLSSVTLNLGGQTSSIVDVDGNIYVTPNSSGSKVVTLTIEDSGSVKSKYLLGTITVVDPQWSYTATFAKSSHDVPDLDSKGNANVTVSAKNKNTNNYDVIVGDFQLEETDNDWSITVTLGENYVVSNQADINLTYNHSEVDVKRMITAFYDTTRNANFSNGIYNTMFIGGCNQTDYSSRVWWSQVNNPLYFPDDNYIEVGSNDTAVMGLMKIGDYLGAIKQSKTTDTAIYLIYPTSFEENTTYAVKQGVQGVGALAKYAFNILGDETLFLSPKGVMAITPSDDDEHKVKNRSYFIDGKLLKEEEIKDAYSFVFDGMYYLAVGGNMYVLDGNQRNSWGNDKTNLVYECYFLTNVPADCFAKYNDSLMFTNEHGLCRFKKRTEPFAFVDAFNGVDENVPVKARWSTVFDDDGSLNYYKTMQKKGNLVSVLPNAPFKYVLADVTEKEFNSDKTRYYTVQDGDYTRCTKEDVYNLMTTYYVRVKTSTKIYVRKDNKDPVEIERMFNEASDIPSELFINKKFKKYKRLQFIIENNEDEDFGVDTIVKQYTVGNYAKK